MRQVHQVCVAAAFGAVLAVGGRGELLRNQLFPEIDQRPPRRAFDSRVDLAVAQKVAARDCRIDLNRDGIIASKESEEAGHENELGEHQRMLIGSTSMATSTPLNFRGSMTASTARRCAIR